jgi:N-acetylmuramoyl-L-alanine amidase
MKKEDIVVALGTAHLITTPGKCSPDKKFREPIYSREIISEVKPIISDVYGIKCFVDYEPLEPTKEMKSSSYKTEQIRELNYRVNFVNSLCDKYGASNVIYISLHNDAAGADNKWHDAGGFTVYTTRGTTISDKLSESMYTAADSTLKYYRERFEDLKKKGLYGKNQKPFREDKTDGDRDKEADFYVIRKTRCASVLIEAMFQDNKADVEFLLSDEGRHGIERTIIEGILRYIEDN